MIVAAAVIEVYVHDSHSLKQKRAVVRAITQRVRNRFGVSIAEVGGQGTWQRAVLGMATVGREGGEARGVLKRVIEFVEGLHLAEVRATDIEIIDLPHELPPESTFADAGEDPLPWEEE